MFPERATKILTERAAMLRQARAFFEERGVLEVDCCALNPRAALDSNIDAVSALVSDQETGFLHTSPEYAMKRLLTNGCRDIYYLGHVFRKNDIGRLHNPEFTMAEWYRLGFSFSEMVQETCEFLFLFLGRLPIQSISYREAFSSYAKLNYTDASLDELQEKALSFGAFAPHEWKRDSLLHFLLTHAIEPYLGQGNLTILTDYPPSEAALACVVEKNGEFVAERFEIYHQGVELANGYHELSDAEELRRRFQKENKARQDQSKEAYLLDEPFLEAMGKGLPKCCGVSVGFDRAFMLKQKAQSLAEVLPFSWKAPTPIS